ncbi:hypothetical protein AYO21_08040 [Fonsecaea monophora]|uniref:Transcription factor domain-containing protein n=1 Tax=Fonsecaea monophora TaxID=254056 RepID=A0A177F0F4_9EURO|nr:hypothetical protein AYO21_08040 [Fonsecaea monophora]KAH0842638.1 putative c6 transcription protein [Fonsecaea pedrosoi]OAG37797.1 hypothetical protein AYO21_08040 [Fonsecaea monophora]
MTEKLKLQVKRHAGARGARQTVPECTNEMGGRNFIIESGKATLQDPSRLGRETQAYTKQSSITTTSAASEAYVAQWMTSVLGFLDDYEQVDDQIPMLARGRDFDVDFLTKYLDYVFPLLFPFYQPGLHETGRSWVLALLRRNKVAFHSAMSLSIYFFIFTLIDTYPEQHGACKIQLWKEVGRQTDRCFEMIQHDIRDLSHRGPQVILIDKARVMESIIQFLIFEVALSRSANWNLHLTPALALFEEIWESTATTASESGLLAALETMAVPLQFGVDPDGCYIWSPEQAGFRFFTGLLVFIDIIASTALEQPPRLLDWHPLLLDVQDNGETDFGKVPIRLSNLMGCQNWVLLAVSQITVLNVWKQNMKKVARLSMIELVDRASQISRSLNDGISSLDEQASDCGKANSLNFRSYLKPGLSASGRTSTTTTRIWAYAAHLYLAVVVSGWQPSTTEIRVGVAGILALLQSIDSPDHLRTLAWPLCVAGCLCEGPGQQEQFRQCLTRVDKFTLVGGLGEARKIMERVWESRETRDGQEWDLAACLRVLGTPALLV